MTTWDGAAGRKEAEAGAARSQEGLLTNRVAGAPSKKNSGLHRWERSRFYRRGSHAEFSRSGMGVAITAENLTFFLGLAVNWESQPLQGLGSFTRAGPIRWKLRVWVWVGQGVLQT